MNTRMINAYPLLRSILSISALLLSYSAFAVTTKMLQQPDISAEHIAFVYAGDIWIADIDGNHPRRLTSDLAREIRPQFSPDGKTIAYSASYNNNYDVYSISIDGGQPKRHTWHPGADLVEDWSPDGTKITFTSRREINHNRAPQMYQVSTRGGQPIKVMEARTEDPVWSKDGKFIAYRPIIKAHSGASGWRQHRGGTTPSIWIYNPKTDETIIIPKTTSGDFQPVWVDNDVYFLSDRDGSVALYGFNKKKGVWPAVATKPWDILSANADNNRIIFDAGGELMVFNTKDHQTKKLSISIKPELKQRRVAWKNVQDNIESAQLSPTGKRVIITARGDVFTLPLKEGSTRNITKSDGIREMTAIWSTKGDRLAYLSDASGQYKLNFTDQNGSAENKSYALSDTKTNYFSLVSFADDDSKILFRDSHLNLKVFDIKTKKISTIATDPVRKGFIEGSQKVALSTDGKWISYSLIGPSYNQILYLYNFDTKVSTAITDGMSDAAQPAFSVDGKYLYFTASTNRGTSVANIDMSQQERPYRAGIYALVLQADGQSPLLPISDEEDVGNNVDDKVEKDKENGDKHANKTTAIDLKNIINRIVALPVPERNYSNLQVASDGALFYLDNPQPGATHSAKGDNSPHSTIMRFDMKEKKAVSVQENIADFSISNDGKKMLYSMAGNKLLTSDAAKKIEGKTLNLANLRMRIDPRKEWLQIFTDAWRMEKDFFYAQNMHGINWQGIFDQYRPLVDHIGSREDLTRLIVEMIAELQVGHNRSYGGDVYRDSPVDVGLLGADIRQIKGKFQIHKIYTGEKWNPFLTAPLAIPGIDIKKGDFILAVNGVPFKKNDNFFSAFENTTGKQVRLTVTNSKHKNRRDVTVVPTGSERNIRLWSWIEKNRKYVDKASNGRVGYVYVPNTTDAGFTFFNRLFFSQLDKDGIIIDERSNGGGQIANYITDVLSRTYLAGYRDRDGIVYGSPVGALDGPKVMLIDQDAGSGGDFLPYAFRHEKIGKLIGTRTWGGLIGIAHNPTLVDGGTLTVPFIRIFDAHKKWLAENKGISPDIEVQLMPKDVNEGIDAQLDKGISEVLKELKTFKPIRYKSSPKTPTKLGK